MIIKFNTRGNDKQRECAVAWVDNSVFDIVYGGSKGSAKSYTGCALIFGDALIYPGTHYFIARKKLNDLRKHTMSSVREVMEHFGVEECYYKYNFNDNFYELHNGSKVFFIQARYEPSDPDYSRFGSMQMTRGWYEEAGEAEEEAVTALMGTVGRWKNDVYNINGKVLQTCNPAKNYLYKKAYKPFKEGTLEDHKRFIQALPTDNKRLPAGYLEHLNRTYNPNQKQRLLLGNWEYDDDPNVLCNYEDILEIFKNDHNYKDENGNVINGNKYLTADIARFGSDKAIVCVWDEWTVIDYKVFKTSSTTQIQDSINHFRMKYKIPKKRCVADGDGVGGGVVDNCGILDFVNGSSPIDHRTKKEREKKLPAPNFNNLQSQCCYWFADRINDFDFYINIELTDKDQEEIIEELEQLKSYESDSDGKMKILPKVLIKPLIGRSPDWRDVFMMRSYFDLNQKYSGKNFVG